MAKPSPAKRVVKRSEWLISIFILSPPIIIYKIFPEIFVGTAAF